MISLIMWAGSSMESSADWILAILDFLISDTWDESWIWKMINTSEGKDSASCLVDTSDFSLLKDNILQSNSVR